MGKLTPFGFDGEIMSSLMFGGNSTGVISKSNFCTDSTSVSAEIMKVVSVALMLLVSEVSFSSLGSLQEWTKKATPKINGMALYVLTNFNVVIRKFC